MENLAEDVTELKQDIKQILQLLEQLNQGADKKPKEEKRPCQKPMGDSPIHHRRLILFSVEHP